MNVSLDIPKYDLTVFQDGIAGFYAVLNDLAAVLDDYPRLRIAVFEGCDEWRRLLQHKLAPQLSGDGCLVAAVAGGTNTGKSTLFNLLLHEQKSAACSTAAATCAPVLVTSAGRHEDAMAGKLLPEFSPAVLSAPEDATNYAMPPDTLWVAESSVLPDSLALLDTPDVDSIERRNWLAADHIRAAGDVVIAVLTPEKYKDARVVDFFRQAHASGRHVVPVMNKANPHHAYAAARKQLAEFIHDAALGETPCFVLPFDYALEDGAHRDIIALDDATTLFEYLLSLDVAEVKRSVYRDTLEYFLYESARFLESLAFLRERLSAVSPSYEKQVKSLTSAYNPQPGAQMSRLLHESIRGRRSALVQGIARINDAALRGLKPVARFMKRRLLGDYAASPMSEEARMTLMREHQLRHIERITSDYVSLLLESVRDMEPVIGGLMRAGIDETNLDKSVKQVPVAVLGENSLFSKAFKEHVADTIDHWWRNNPGYRNLLLELDAFLVLAPAAVGAPLAVFTAGVGAPELLTLAGPMAGEFVARIMENKFADQWVGLLQPWQQEQRDKLANAIHDNITAPCLCAVNDAITIFDWGYLEKLGRYWELCQTGFQES